VVSTGALVGVRLLKLTGSGILLTAEIGRAFIALKPLIWMGMAPCGRVFPAKIMFLDPFFADGSVNVLGGMGDAPGIGKRLIVAFFGSPPSVVTATGMAVAYSRPPT
jgi:hypothetical protein